MSKPPQPAPDGRRRGRAARFRRRALRGLALLALAFVVVAALFADRIEDRARRELERRLAAASGAPVSIGALELRPLLLGAELRGVRLELPVRAGLQVRAEVPAGRVRLSWRGLARLGRGQIRLREVILERPTLVTTQEPAPAEPGPPTSEGLELDLAIGRLEVLSGTWVHSDVARRFDLQAEAIDLSAAWSRGRRAMLGRLAATIEIAAPSLTRPVRFELSADLRQRGGRIAVRRYRLRSAAATLGGSAELDVSGALEASGTTTAYGDLGPLSRLLAAGAPPLEGALEATVGWSVARSGWQVAGDLSSRSDLRYGGLHVDALRARVEARSGRLELRDVEAVALGGRIAGGLEWDFERGSGFTARLAAREAAAAHLLAWLDVPLPLDGEIDADLRLRGSSAAVAEWSGEGRFEVRATPVRAARVPFRATGRVELDDGRFGLLAHAVETQSATLDVEMRLDVGRDPAIGFVQLAGRTEDAGRTKVETLTLVRGVAGELPAWAGETLGGRGTFDARIGVGPGARHEVALDLGHGTLGLQPFERLQADVAWDGTEVRFRDLRLEHRASRLAGRGRLGLPAATWTEAEVEVTDVDLAPALALAGLADPPAGRVTGALGLWREAGVPRGQGRAVVEDLSWLGERIERAETVFEIGEGSLTAREVHARGPGIELRGSLRWPLGAARVEIEGLSGELRLDELGAVRRAAWPAEGRVTLEGTLAATAEGVAGDLDVRCDDARYADRGLGAFAGVLRLEPERIEGRLAEAGSATWTIEGGIGLRGEMPLDATVRLEEAWFHPVPESDPPLSVQATGHAVLGGPLSDLGGLRADGRIDRALVRVGATDLTLTEPLPIALAGGTLVAEPIRLRGPEFAFESGVRLALVGGAIETTARGELDAALLTLLLPDFRASGKLDVDVRAAGSLEALVWSGSARLRGGRLRWLGVPFTLDAIDADVAFAGDEARVTSLRAVLGGGEISGTGVVGLDPQRVRYLLDLDAARARVRWPSGFEWVFDARVRIEGAGEDALASGRIEVLQGLYERDLVLGELLGIGVREYSSDALELPGEFRLDLDIDARDNAWIRNNAIKAETGLDLHLGGHLLRPELTGRITVFEGGKLTFRDVEYRILSGTADFVELDRIDPYLSLRAETDVARHRITLRMDGRLARFEYELTSDPALPTQDIIALLATGRTLRQSGARAADEPPAGAGVAASYFAGALTRPVERQLERALPVERVQISPLLVEGEADPTTRITVGKRVSDEVFVVVSSDIGSTERQLYQVEWQATPHVQVVASRDTQGGLGGDIGYHGRFWWRRPPAAGPPAPGGGDAAAEEAPALRVGEVRFSGVAAEDVEALRARVGLRSGDPLRRSSGFEGAQAIRRHFVERGRIGVEVELETVPRPGSDLGDLVYTVRPGAQYVLELEGASDEKEQRRLRRELEALWVEGLYVEGPVRDAAELIRRSYRSRGHYAVDVRPHLESKPDAELLRLEIDPGPPVRVRSLEVLGARGIDEERIRRQILTRPWSVFNRSLLEPDTLRADVAAIRNLYRDQGYLEVRVAEPEIALSLDGDEAHVRLVIAEGRQFRVADVRAEGGGPLDAPALAAGSGLQPGQVYSTSALIEGENRIRAALDSAGHPDARVRGQALLEDARVHVVYEVEPGPARRVGEIAVEGNRLTRDKVIRRELELRPGQAVSRDAILRTQHNLYRLGIFRSVHIERSPLGEPDEGLERVVVHVDEARPLGMGFGVGYDTEGGARFSFTTSHDNFAGRDQVVGIHGYRSSVLERLQLLLEEPRLFGNRNPTLFSVLREDQDEAEFRVRRAGVAVRVDHRFGAKWNGFVRYNFQNVELSEVEDELEALSQKLESGVLGDVGWTIARDTRDDPFSPHSGGYVGWSANVFAEPLLSEASFVKTTITLSNLWRLRGDLGVASSVRLGAAIPFGDTETIPLSERFFAGGDSTLRGFERDEVGPRTESGRPTGGEALLLWTQELRFPIWRQLRGKLFVDVGNVYEELGAADLGDTREVGGLGVYLDTPIGPLRLEYGRKLDRRAGESRGELFLAFGTAF